MGSAAGAGGMVAVATELVGPGRMLRRRL
eukprot:COSAG03_NODE_11416_length_594_cov_0.674747_2_plen_28_part_01